MTNIVKQIGNNLDDGFASDGGVDWEANSGGNNAGWAGALPREYTAVYSFAATGIPQGATISAATLSVWIKSHTSAVTVRVVAQKVAIAAQPSGTNTPFSWGVTTAKGSFAGTPTDSAYQAIDVKDVIQEIVNQASFDAGRINIMVRNDGMVGGTNQLEECWDFSDGNDVNKLAKLDVTYTAGAATPIQGRCTIIIEAVKDDTNRLLELGYGAQLFSSSPAIIPGAIPRVNNIIQPMFVDLSDSPMMFGLKLSKPAQGYTPVPPPVTTLLPNVGFMGIGLMRG
jgi:hypothetical protein